MANQIAVVPGNFTAVGTYLTADTTSASIAGVTATTVGTVAGTLTDSATFTPGVITVQGILLQLSRRIASTGTIAVSLRNSTGGINVATCTVNVADLPAETAVATNASSAADGSWHFFDFGTPVTILGATAYLVRVITSNATQVALLGGASNDWNRLLVTTSAPGSLAAGDRFWIGQRYTGAGTATTITVTMDNNTTTAWGQIVNSNGGTFKASIAAATQLRQAGIYQGWAGSTTQWGTAASPCVLGQQTVWEMASAADGQFGFEFYWNANVSFYGASKGFAYSKLAADASASATSLTLADSVGSSWKNGDVLLIAGTTRTAADTETKAMGADGSGTSIPTIAALTNAHSGTAPTQGHVANLTRDLKIRSTAGSTTTNGFYIWYSPNYIGTAVHYWGEYVNMGSIVANKLGFTAANLGGSLDLEYNSIHDFTETTSIGINLSSSSGLNYTVSNNVGYNLRTFISNTSTTATGWTINANLTGGNTVQNGTYNITDIGGTFTNNIVFGTLNGGGIGIQYGEANAAIGTCSGNQCYNNIGVGFSVNAYISGTISNLLCWRNNTFGLTWSGTNSFNGNPAGLVFDGYVCFGNTTAGAESITSQAAPVTFTNGVFNGGVTLVQPVGIAFLANSNMSTPLILRNCSFGATTQHTTGDLSVNSVAGLFVYTENCLFSSATPLAGQTNMSSNSFIQHDAYQQTAGNWLKLTHFGSMGLDTVIFNTGAESVKMTPSSAATKLQSDAFRVPVNSGQTCTSTVFVRKGTSYNGNQQRLFVKANAALGINTDTLLATAGAAIGTWESLSAATATVTENGVLDFYIDCDGTAGTVNYDTASAIVT